MSENKVKSSVLFRLKNTKNMLSSFILIVLTIMTTGVIVYLFFSLFSDKISMEYKLLSLTGIGWLIGQAYLKNKELEQNHINKKQVIYQEYINTFLDFFLKNKNNVNVKSNNTGLSQNDLNNAFLELQKAVYIWGKPQMIKDMLKLKEMLSVMSENNYRNSDEHIKHIIKTLNFQFEMIRKDLGHNDSSLKNYELAQMCFNENVREIMKR